MKYCNSCKLELSDNHGRFCPNCGKELSGDCTLGTKKHPMKWFKFLTNFSLFFTATLELLIGFNVLRLTFDQSSIHSETDTIIFFNRAFSVSLFALALLQIVTRFSLAKFKRMAPMLIYTIHTIYGLLFAIYCFGYVTLIGNVVPPFLIVMTILVLSALLGLILNYKYFEKRKSLFVN